MPRIRVVVPVHNEKILLPWFLRHYRRIAESIVVWDNGSDDGSPEIARRHGADVRTFLTDGYDEAAVLGRLHETLDESDAFEWALFPDVDEFLTGEVAKRLSEAPSDVVAPAGYILIRRPDEPPLDPGRDLVGQRRFGYWAPRYAKPVLVRPRARVRFAAGKHELAPGALRPYHESRLRLFHHDLIDFDLWVYRKTKRALSENNRRNGWSTMRFCRDRSFYESFWRDEEAKASYLGHLLGDAT